jgi:hypothetical protein
MTRVVSGKRQQTTAVQYVCGRKAEVELINPITYKAEPPEEGYVWGAKPHKPARTPLA